MPAPTQPSAPRLGLSITSSMTQPIQFYDFVALAATALGKGPPRRIPAWLAGFVAGTDPVHAVTRSAKSSNARIKSELGWEPRFPTADQGVPDAIARMDQTARA